MSQCTPIDPQPTELKAIVRESLRLKKELAQLKAIETGVGFSSDKTAAIYFECARSTIWKWVQDGVLDPPVKITPNHSRFENSMLKAKAEALRSAS